MRIKQELSFNLTKIAIKDVCIRIAYKGSSPVIVRINSQASHDHFQPKTIHQAFAAIRTLRSDFQLCEISRFRKCSLEFLQF